VEPFDTLRDNLPGWTLVVTELEGLMGSCDPATRTIWIDSRLDDLQQRSTMVHEAVHAERGDMRDDPCIEVIVQNEAARRLIPLDALLGTIEWASHPADITRALRVDMDTVRTRLRNLTAMEKAAVRDRFIATFGADRPDPTSDHCMLGQWWRRAGQPDPMPCHCNNAEQIAC
jgi:hypothetical protein